MEELKGFEDLAEKIEPYNLSEGFIKEFSEYMKNSIRESNRMHAEANESAKHIYLL